VLGHLREEVCWVIKGDVLSHYGRCTCAVEPRQMSVGPFKGGVLGH
jgi:hypothetical protein